MLLRRCGWLLLLGLGACAYTSDYVPPGDGRARVLWQDGEAVASVPALGDACRSAAFQAARGSVATAGPEVHVHPGVYIDHAVWIDAPYLGPRLPPPVLFGPHSPRPPPSPVGGPHRALPAPPRGKTPSAPSLSGGSSGPSEAWIVVAVVAIATMPIIATVLALSRPEDEEQAAGSVDLVNAYNDLLRTEGTACRLPPADPLVIPAGSPEVTP